jgi:Uma2 family endonuclease
MRPRIRRAADAAVRYAHDMSDTSLAEIAVAHRQPISVAMYHQMIDSDVLTKHDRVELIEGVIVAVSPQSPAHIFAVTTLVYILNTALGPEWRVRPGGPLTLARSEPEPDIAVVRTALEEEAVRHPTTASLVVEVAKTSLSLDRGLASIYAEADVTEYWIVDVKRQQVEVYRDPEGTTYRTRTVATIADTLVPVELPGVTVVVSSLFRVQH